MARNKQPKPVHQLTARQFDNLFKTEEDCIRYLVIRRWPDGIRCPRCGPPSASIPCPQSGRGIGSATSMHERKLSLLASDRHNL